MGTKAEKMQRILSAGRLLQDCFFYFVIIVLTGVLFDIFQETHYLSAENYFDFSWAIGSSFLLELMFFSLSQKAKTARSNENGEKEDSDNSKFKEFSYGWFSFFGVWLFVTGVLDLFRDSPNYPIEFHIGIGFSFTLALFMLVDAYIKKRLN